MPEQQNSLDGPKWAEFDPTLPPQVAMSSAPEHVGGIEMGNLRPGHDGAGDMLNEPNSQVNPQSHTRSRLWNWKSVILICAAMALVAVILPVVLVTVLRDKAPNRDDTITVGDHSSTQSSSSGPTKPLSSTMLPSPSSNRSPAPECIPSDFRRDVVWIGIYKQEDWNWNLVSARNAKDCCTACHQSTPEGCNGWLYVPSNTNTPPCNLVQGFAGPNKTSSCPEGHPDIIFAEEDNKPNNFGGAGPCTGSIRG